MLRLATLLLLASALTLGASAFGLGGAPHPLSRHAVRRGVCTAGGCRPPRALRMSAAAASPDEDDGPEDDAEDVSAAGGDDVPDISGSADQRSGEFEWSIGASDMAALSQRMDDVKEGDEVRKKLEELSHAWVLVFDADTDDEAVYSMELEAYDSHVVLAFEDKLEAEQYADTLEDVVEYDSGSVVFAP